MYNVYYTQMYIYTIIIIINIYNLIIILINKHSKLKYLFIN